MCRCVVLKGSKEFGRQELAKVRKNTFKGKYVPVTFFFRNRLLPISVLLLSDPLLTSRRRRILYEPKHLFFSFFWLGEKELPARQLRSEISPSLFFGTGPRLKEPLSLSLLAAHPTNNAHLINFPTELLCRKFVRAIRRQTCRCMYSD